MLALLRQNIIYHGLGALILIAFNFSTGNEKKKCHCGAKNCSGFLGVRPKTQSAMQTEEKAKKAAAKRKKKRTKKNVVKEGN